MTFQTLRYIRRKRLLWKADDYLRNPRPRSWNLTSQEHRAGFLQWQRFFPVFRNYGFESKPEHRLYWLEFSCFSIDSPSKRQNGTFGQTTAIFRRLTYRDLTAVTYISWTEWSKPAPFSILFNYYRGLVLGRKANETWYRAFTSIYCKGWERVELFFNSPTLRYAVQPNFLRLPYTTFPWAGYLSRYSDWLRAGRSEIESRWGRDFPPVQSGPGAHPVSCKMGTGSFPGVKCDRGVLLTTHPLLVPRSWKSRAIPLPTLWATPGV